MSSPFGVVEKWSEVEPIVIRAVVLSVVAGGKGGEFVPVDAIVVETDEEVKILHDLMTQLSPHEGKSVIHGGKHP